MQEHSATTIFKVVDMLASHTTWSILKLTVLSGDGSVHDEGDKSNHSQTSVDDFGFFGESGLHCWHVSESFLVAGVHGFKVGVVGVDEERVSERKRADGGAKGHGKEMGVGNKDDGTFVADGFLSRDGGKGSPLLKVEGHFGVGDQSVSLSVGGAHDEEPSKHSVTAVPLFGLDGGSPSPFGEGRELRFPVGLGIVVHGGRDDFQRRSAVR